MHQRVVTTMIWEIFTIHWSLFPTMHGRRLRRDLTWRGVPLGRSSTIFVFDQRRVWITKMMEINVLGLTTYYIKNYPSVDNQGKPAIRLVNRERQTLRNTNTLNYDFKKYLKEDHSLNLMAGHRVYHPEGSYPDR